MVEGGVEVGGRWCSSSPRVPGVDGDVQGLEVNRVVVFGGYKSLSDDLSG